MEAVAEAPTITISGHVKPLGEIAKSVGYQNSAVWCRDMAELVGVLGHGQTDFHISSEDATKVASYLVEHGMAEEVVAGDGTKGWNIHRNENALSRESKAKAK